LTREKLYEVIDLTVLQYKYFNLDFLLSDLLMWTLFYGTGESLKVDFH